RAFSSIWPDVRGSRPTTTRLFMSPRALPALSTSSGVIISLTTPLIPDEPKSPIAFLLHCNGFCEVAGLVDRAAPALGHVIREQLQNDGRHDGRNVFAGVGHPDHDVGQLVDGSVALVGD